MDEDRFDALAKTAAASTSRRAVVAAGVKLAYAAPLVAATAAVSAADAAAACACPSGAVAIPDAVIAALRKAGLKKLADALSGQCLGCQTGTIKPPKTSAQWATSCRSIGKAVTSVCPGKSNRIVLKPRECVSG